MYFNPALLAASAPSASMTAVFLDQRLQVERDLRPPGYDVPESVYDARLAKPGGGTQRLELRPLPTGRLPVPDTASEGGANLFLLGGTSFRPHERVGLGLHFVLPTSRFQAQHPHYLDEREQFSSNALHFERLGDRLSGMAMSVGLGVGVLDTLALGLGATLLNDAVARAEVYLPDAADQSTALTNAHVEVSSRVAPHFAVAVFPFGVARAQTLTLAGTVHLASYGEVDAISKLRFWNYDYPDGQDALVQRTRFTYLYEPLRGTLALSGEVVDSLRLAGTLRYARWSGYRARQAASVARFEDVVEGSLDAAYEVYGWRLGMGGVYAPSPVPAQTGRTNVVDNDRLGGRLACGYTAALGDGHLSIGLDLGLQRLMARRTLKAASAKTPVLDELPDGAVDARTGAPLPEAAGLQTNNPGFPGFASAGWLSSAGLTVAWRWGAPEPTHARMQDSPGDETQDAVE